MPISFVFAVLALILIGGWLFVRFFRTHIQGNNAPEQTVQVTILDKQVIPIADAQPGEDDQSIGFTCNAALLDQNGSFKLGYTISTHSTQGTKGHSPTVATSFFTLP